MLTNEIGLQLYMRPLDASALAGPDGICGLTPDYSGGLWVPALPQAESTPERKNYLTPEFLTSAAKLDPTH